MNYSLSQVLPLGVLTGSRAFNCAMEKSNWDIAILKPDLPNYMDAWNYICTEDMSEHTEFDDDEGFIEYDQILIWGPLIQIIKYWDDDDNCINLFVYEDHNGIILDKFRELNQLMNFIHNIRLSDRDYRIKAFTEIAASVGITNAQY